MTHPSLQSRVVQLDNATHHGPARDPATISLIVMHCTAGEGAHGTIVWMNQQATPISYAYIIDRDGTIYRMCDPALIAYHAGDSAWPSPVTFPPGNGGHSVNRISLGIAWANRDDGEAVTDAQLESALWLCGVYMDRTHIPIDRVVGHYEVSPGRKIDPKPAIDMGAFRALLSGYRSVT